MWGSSLGALAAYRSASRVESLGQRPTRWGQAAERASSADWVEVQTAAAPEMPTE